jgi:parvulin-like peptidyl-prolyl isomerase
LSRLQNLLRSNDIDPEARNRFLLTAGMVAVVVVALGLIAVGYYVDRIAPRGDTVFTVADREFSYSYLEDRVDAANAEGTFAANDVVFGIAQVVADIQNEELIRLIAAEDGVSLTEEELEQGMREDAGVPSAARRDVLASALRGRLQEIGLSLDHYEEKIEAVVLQQKLEGNIAAGLPAELEQVDLKLIQVQTDAEAATARDRIAAGEAFEDVAGEVSRHASASAGGVLGWTPRDVLNPQLADAVFALAPGTANEVVETEDGFYIVNVDGKEVRALEEATRARLASTRFGERLEEASNRYPLQNLVTNEQAQRLAGRLRSSGG